MAIVDETELEKQYDTLRSELGNSKAVYINRPNGVLKIEIPNKASLTIKDLEEILVVANKCASLNSLKAINAELIKAGIK